MTLTATAAPGWLRLENRHTGEVLEMRRRRESGEVALDLRGTLPPRRQGPPLHIHYLEDEMGVVRAGVLSAIAAGKQVKVRAGESVQLPRGIPHRWWNDGDELLVFEGTVRPVVDLDRCLHAIFEVLNAGPPDRPPLFYLAHLALRHRPTQAALVLPAPVQAVLFRVVVAIGAALGRYRGTDWPGCPVRCTGAPESSFV
jgi:quercetin dioxygenase-like cupin family protein